MGIIPKIPTVIIVALLLACNNSSKRPNTIKAKNDTSRLISNASQPIDTPRSFVRNYGATDNNRLFVFVGEKITVESLPSGPNAFDNGFTAKYLILQKVFGDFTADTIEFVAYDHYGIPDFSKFKNVLLFVSADSGTYYQQKYMYNDVYKTKDGRWAGTYAWEDFEHDYNKHTKIKPVKISFAESVYYPTKIVDNEGRTRTRSFPKPYFKTVRDTAIAVYGNYVEDLFALKRDGYLTARELFKKGKLIQ